MLMDSTSPLSQRAQLLLQKEIERGWCYHKYAPHQDGYLSNNKMVLTICSKLEMSIAMKKWSVCTFFLYRAYLCITAIWHFSAECREFSVDFCAACTYFEPVLVHISREKYMYRPKKVDGWMRYYIKLGRPSHSIARWHHQLECNTRCDELEGNVNVLLD